MGYALKNIVTVVLDDKAKDERYDYLDVLLFYYHDSHWDDEICFILMDTLISVPIRRCEPHQIQELLDFTRESLNRNNLEIRAAALRFLEYLALQPGLLASQARQIMDMLQVLPAVLPVGLQYNLRKIYEILGQTQAADALRLESAAEQQAASELFLENQKVATPWMLKMTNIDFLMEAARNRSVSLLQVASHLSNILKVGERISVRHRAGQGLVDIAP